MRTVAQERRITVFDADVQLRDDVATNLLRPVFDHLAATLARMDRANIELVLQEAGETAAEVVRFADDTGEGGRPPAAGTAQPGARASAPRS